MRSFSPSRLVHGAALLAGLASCNMVPAGSMDGGADGGASASQLPCDVSAVLQSRCQSCHSSPPVAGAPMPLVSWADTQAAARSAPSQSVWQLMQQRIHDARNPMPPAGSGALTDAERSALDGWLNQRAPAAAGPACATPDAAVSPPRMIGPQYLPCAPSLQRSYTAHALGATTPYHLAADAGNSQICFTWRSTLPADTQAVAFAPIIGDARVLHHYILFETATPQTEGGAGPCHMPGDATFLTGWAPGGGNSALPPDVGMRMPGPDRWFILQVHYWNVAGYSDVNDASGVAFCTADTPRQHVAQISTLGSLAINLPPRSTGTTATGNCTPTNTEPVHIISAAPHMHRLGTSFQTVLMRGGSTANPTMVVQLPRWDFNAQTSYPADVTVMPGDVLRTTCTYDNPGSASVFFGENTEDEMCFDFVLAWPAGQLSSGGQTVTARCLR